MKKTINSILLISAASILVSCADVEPSVGSCLRGHTYGFWAGLWHGYIALFSFIGSLFNDDTAVYAVNNNGGWYNFGFMIGIGSFGGTASKAR